ncbi:MAG: hypothetical protein KTR25_14080 [Myxococcales bacterium]|nr:hypothetical protein [Myxococcales bacterium]
MERPDRLRLSSVAYALFIRSVPRKRNFADHPSHFSDGLLEISPRSRTARYARLVVRAFYKKPGSIATHMAKSRGC